MENQSMLIISILGTALGGLFVWAQQKRLQRKKVPVRIKRQKPSP